MLESHIGGLEGMIMLIIYRRLWNMFGRSGFWMGGVKAGRNDGNGYFLNIYYFFGGNRCNIYSLHAYLYLIWNIGESNFQTLLLGCSSVSLLLFLSVS